MVFRVFLVLQDLLETRALRAGMVAQGSLVNLDLEDLLEWMVWLEPRVSQGHLEPEDNRERKEREEYQVKGDLLDLRDLLVKALVMMLPLWPLCWDKETQRYFCK